MAPQRRATDPAASARREDTVSQLAALSVRMHATLVKTGLQQALTAPFGCPTACGAGVV